MSRTTFNSIFPIGLLFTLVLILSCGDDQSTEPTAATVTGAILLPEAANGFTYDVLIDEDINGDNGFVAATSGVCGSETSISYSISNVPAGTYYVYGCVHLATEPGSAPGSGDCIGMHGGSIFSPPSAPNVVVPSSGTVTCDITMVVWASQPQSGDWTATTGFGSLDFQVNQESTAITSIKYNFSSWTCGIVTLSGSVGISSPSGWAISDRQFTIKNTLDMVGNQTMTISGSFGDSGDQASGTWKAVMYGSTCSGTWEASPVQ